MQQYLEQILRDKQNQLREDQKYCIDQYIDFINECIKLDLTYEHNRVTERHHIVPVSWRKDLEKDKNNLVVLTLDQHIIAHGLLAKTEYSVMVVPLWSMLATRQTEKTIDQKIDWLVSQLTELDKKYSVELDEKKNIEYLIALRQSHHSQLMHDVMMKIKARKVMCLNTGVIYDSLTDAGKAYSISCAFIIQACVNKTKCRGQFWIYLDDVDDPTNYKVYLEQYQQRAKENRKRPNKHTFAGVGGGGKLNYTAKPIINIETGEILEYARLLDIRNTRKPNYTLYAINRFAKIEGALWTYYDSSKTLEQQRQEVLEKEKKYRAHVKLKDRKVICVETNQVYDDVKVAAKQEQISKQKVVSSCIVYNKTNGKSFRFLDKLNNPYIP